MRDYRYPADTLRNADSEGFMRLKAEDVNAALKACPRSDITPAQLQVRTCQGFQFTTEVPVHLGGISHR